MGNNLKNIAQDTQEKITESTLFPLSLIIVVISFVFWLSANITEFKNYGAKIERLETIETARSERDREIISRLTRIETLLEKGRK